AAGYLSTQVGSLKFETELRSPAVTPSARLAALASLQRDAGRAGLAPEDLGPIHAKLGELGGMIEADAKISAALAMAQAPVVHRLTLLLKLAMGEAAPLGPAADRARGAAGAAGPGSRSSAAGRARGLIPRPPGARPLERRPMQRPLLPALALLALGACREPVAPTDLGVCWIAHG